MRLHRCCHQASHHCEGHSATYTFPCCFSIERSPQRKVLVWAQGDWISAARGYTYTRAMCARDLQLRIQTAYAPVVRALQQLHSHLALRPSGRQYAILLTIGQPGVNRRVRHKPEAAPYSCITGGTRQKQRDSNALCLVVSWPRWGMFAAAAHLYILGSHASQRARTILLWRARWR